MAEPGFYMPVPGEPNAPVFDPAHPSQIRWYFTQLERLFARAALLDDHQEMKFYTTFFIDADLATLWEAFPEFNSPSSTFEDFKTVLIAIYAGYSKYTLSDLHSLISESHKSDIHSLRELNDYHLRFQAISSDLITSGQLDPIGQTLTYPQGFPPTFWSFILQRLSIQFPEHHVIDPFPISDVYDAARFVLHSPALRSTPPTVYAMDSAVANPAHSPLLISAPLAPLAPSSLISDSPAHPKVSAIIENLKDSIATILQSDRVPAAFEIKPWPIIANPAHHISIPSSEASPYIPSSRISSAADSDRIAHLEKELEILCSQQDIFAQSAPSQPLEIPGYEPPDVPNFGSVPPRRPKLAAPPVLQAQPPRSPPGLPARPLRPPVVPKHFPDLPLAIQHPPLSPNTPNSVLDTSPSHPEPSHISETPSKSLASVTLGELLSVAPEITSCFEKLVTAPSNTALVSTRHSPIASIRCFSLEIPQSIAPPSPTVAPPAPIIVPSSLISAPLSPIVVPPLSYTALSSSFTVPSFSSSSSLSLVSSSLPALSASSLVHSSLTAPSFSFSFIIFILLSVAQILHQFICSFQHPRIILRTPGEPPPSALRIL